MGGVAPREAGGALAVGVGLELRVEHGGGLCACGRSIEAGFTGPDPSKA